ncbi:hypothetical protein MM2B0107_2678 [Mycobacteroides abscessus subsp. bolletii 2B-0107]|nr:hypothetical protein MM2B0107_2678 [Mycobacteroides abscessus subsp. bolletii 2B-0107]
MIKSGNSGIRVSSHKGLFKRRKQLAPLRRAQGRQHSA